MYAPILASRYLRSRVIPLVAVAAVALCVALVIIVVSVMTGFLDMVKQSGRTLMGDVAISYQIRGLPRYERLIELLEARAEVHAAAPVIDGWGLLRMPYPEPDAGDTETVQFWATDPERFARVTGFAGTLHWRPLDPAHSEEIDPEDFRRDLTEEMGPEGLQEMLDEGLTLTHSSAEGGEMPGVVLGLHVSDANRRLSGKGYRPFYGKYGYWWMPRFKVVLTTLPPDTLSTSPQPQSAVLQVVNEFASGVFLIDDTRIFVPLEVGQRLLNLGESKIVDDEGEETGDVDPARSTMVIVRAAEGIDPPALRSIVSEVYAAYRAELAGDQSLDLRAVPPPVGEGVVIQTWEEQQASLTGPIEKERELMRTLFSLVYLVCAGLVLAIFWAIVYEKTRDIGILRSIGASRVGISLIFLRYGLIIGVLGALVGAGLAWLVVRNINHIHTMLGHPPLGLAIAAGAAGVGCALWLIADLRRDLLLPVVLKVLGVSLLSLICAVVLIMRSRGGIVIWDPAVYYFNEIPSQMDLVTTATTMLGAVIFSVLGAFLPAARAADTDPVKALRYE